MPKTKKIKRTIRIKRTNRRKKRVRTKHKNKRLKGGSKKSAKKPVKKPAKKPAMFTQLPGGKDETNEELLQLIMERLEVLHKDIAEDERETGRENTHLREEIDFLSQRVIKNDFTDIFYEGGGIGQLAEAVPPEKGKRKGKGSSDTGGAAGSGKGVGKDAGKGVGKGAGKGVGKGVGKGAGKGKGKGSSDTGGAAGAGRGKFLSTVETTIAEIIPTLMPILSTILKLATEGLQQLINLSLYRGKDSQILKISMEDAEDIYERLEYKLIPSCLYHVLMYHTTHDGKTIDGIDESHMAIIRGRTWQPDTDTKICMNCEKDFNVTRRRHHCRSCGLCICSDCSETMKIFHILEKKGFKINMDGSNELICKKCQPFLDKRVSSILNSSVKQLSIYLKQSDPEVEFDPENVGYFDVKVGKSLIGLFDRDYELFFYTDNDNNLIFCFLPKVLSDIDALNDSDKIKCVYNITQKRLLFS